MAIVSRGGREISPYASQQAAGQAAAQQATNATLGLQRAIEQEQATQLRAINDQATALVNEFGPYAAQVNPGLIDQWARLTGVEFNPSQMQPTPMQERNWRVAQAAVAGMPPYAQQAGPPPAPAPAPTRGEKIPATEGLRRSGGQNVSAQLSQGPVQTNAPQGPGQQSYGGRPSASLSEMASRPVYDQADYARRQHQQYEELRQVFPAEGSNDALASQPAGIRRELLRVLEKYPQIDDPELREAIGTESTFNYDRVKQLITERQRALGQTLKQTGTQSTEVRRGLYVPVAGEKTVLGEMADRIERGSAQTVGDAVGIATNVLRQNADRLFGGAVVRDENGEVVGVRGRLGRDPNGEERVFRLDNLGQGSPFRNDGENAQIVFGNVTGADLNKLRQYLIGHALGQDGVDPYNPLNANGQLIDFQEGKFGEPNLNGQVSNVALSPSPSGMLQNVSGLGPYTTPSVEGPVPHPSEMAGGWSPFTKSSAIGSKPETAVQKEIEDGRSRFRQWLDRRRKRRQNAENVSDRVGAAKVAGDADPRQVAGELRQVAGGPVFDTPQAAEAYLRQIDAYTARHPQVFPELENRRQAWATEEEERKSRELANQLTSVYFEDGEVREGVKQAMLDMKSLEAMHIYAQIMNTYGQLAMAQAAGVSPEEVLGMSREEAQEEVADAAERMSEILGEKKLENLGKEQRDLYYIEAQRYNRAAALLDMPQLDVQTGEEGGFFRRTFGFLPSSTGSGQMVVPGRETGMNEASVRAVREFNAFQGTNQ